MVKNDILDDFKVVCDRSNNSDCDIRQGKVTVDITIRPKATLDFIYIPITVKKHEE
jgi:phage tail sheath protein FI